MPAQNLPGLMLDYAHPLARGLVGWWPLNEGGGERVTDISGNGNHGLINSVLPGATSGWKGGALGRSLAMDGTDDYVLVPHSASLAITGPLTISFFAVLTSVANYRFPITKCATGTPYAAPYDVQWNIGDATVQLYRGTTITHSAVSGAVTPLGVPIHIVAVDDRTTANVWTNGAAGPTPLASSGWSIADAGDPLYIGKRRDGYPFAGQMSHVRIYNRALSAAEIAQLYADPLAGALAPARASRYYSVAAPVADPPTPPTLPMSADRLNNRTFARTWRRGETG